jgi:cytochrome c oxidase subunit 3
MVITGTSTRPVEKTGKRIGGRSGFPGPNGKGPRGNGHGRREDWPRKFSPAAYRITSWVLIAAVVMMFAALSSAYIILSSGSEVRPISMPRLFYVSTGIILLSSLSFETARRSLKLGRATQHSRWLGVTLILGFLFLGAQLMGWRELVQQGVFFAGHPRSSFFFLFTGLHGMHLLGGMLALIYLVATVRREQHPDDEKKLASTEAVSRYWHAMDGIWIWLFLLLLIWG